MKKIGAGFLAGVLAATAATAYAEEIGTLVGRAVEGALPLVINGKKAERDVIVVDGTSYLPVRAAGEMFGYDVDFIRGQVVLDNRQAEEQDSAAPQDGVIYSIRTGLFPLNSAKGTILERDGNQYVSALVFLQYLSNDGTTVTVRLPGRTAVEFPVDGTYTPGAAGFNEDGLYVSLAALGLQAVLNGTGATLVQN